VFDEHLSPRKQKLPEVKTMATELRKTDISGFGDEAGIERLTEKVKQRVIEQINELRVANEELRKEIIERKLAEEKVKQSESQLAEAQRVAHVGSWDWDLRSNTVTWSDELYRIFGFQPGGIDVASEAMSFIHPEDRYLVKSTVNSAVKNREPYSFYYRVLRPDGDERIVHSRGHIVSDAKGDPLRVFGATQDVTELKRAEQKLKATSEQLRALSARVQAAREEEGARIAREIHDELGSALTSLRWGLDEIDNILSTTAPKGDGNTVRRKIAALTTLVEGTVHTVREISSELRLSFLDDMGLVATLEWEMQKFEARTGIIRHAHATTVDITVTEQKGEFVLQVEDNGKGMKEADISGTESLGLLGMRERAHLIGGDVSITSAEGSGTVVAVQVPIVVQELVRTMAR